MKEEAGALVEGRDLHRAYALGQARVPALRGVSIAIAPGEFVALQGPSGSGKTTLLNLLGLLDAPDSGRVVVEDKGAEALTEDERSDLRRDRFGFVFQTFNLIAVLTAEENVAYPLALKGLDGTARRDRARELLASVGLPDKAGVRPDLLSGGQRQRVAIARALANDPAIVFADEPTANLDSHTADEILELMRGINASRGVSFLFATHDPNVVRRARRVVTLHDGVIASDRAP
jgi:putative ABC transport system ATP-binding protein